MDWDTLQEIVDKQVEQTGVLSPVQLPDPANLLGSTLKVTASGCCQCRALTGPKLVSFGCSVRAHARPPVPSPLDFLPGGEEHRAPENGPTDPQTGAAHRPAGIEEHLDPANGPTNPDVHLRLFGKQESDIRVLFYRDHAAWCPYCQRVCC